MDVLEYLSLEISVLKYSALGYLPLHGNSWPSKGCNIPQNVGHFCAEIFSDGHFCAGIFSDGHFCAGIFNVEIFSFPREILAFQWLQYPPYRWTFLRCKPFPLSPASSHNKQTITAKDKQTNQA